MLRSEELSSFSSDDCQALGFLGVKGILPCKCNLFYRRSMAFETPCYLSNNLDTLVFCELRVYLICKVVNFHGKKKKSL